ncbi:MAG: transglycosylase domain-containing protein [Bacteroides sp.]|nr:transglycosylase domain-containing protein [Bacteroides sp.]
MKRIILRGLLIISVLMFAGISAIAGMGYKLFSDALESRSLSEAVEEIRSGEDFTPIEKLPETYLEAIVAVEDHRFEEHCGVDAVSVARAAWNNILARSLVEGGSTITQQLAKNMFFTQEKSFVRKAAELFMAFKIEAEYSKSEILELYVNSIYFGSGYYNVKDACEGYFGKEPENMTEYECTLLAGIPNAPSVYSLDSSPELAAQRQRHVVEQMVKYGYISETEGECLRFPCAEG